ncbi:MAG: PAS domain-containing protein [Rhodospirillales bacterium]|nr:PAS domain-containing protein [Rhodospirillales bacterium]MBO6788318.1 PAS domain-containing protein [Rhodospirillales bacterium]
MDALDDRPVAYVNGTADDCLSPLTGRVIAYWQERMPAGGGLPRWSDFDLMDLYEVAPSLAVKDVIDDGRDYVNRFWGTSLTVALGFEGSGKLVSTYEPESMRKAVSRRYAHVVSTGETSMARGHIANMPGKEYLAFELVHLPLWGRHDKVEHILSAYDFGFRAP